MNTQNCDVVIVGAGFSGLYLLHRLRGLGYSVRVFEAGDDVGGTWYWNRYPGARCDVESMQYSYSFSEELQQEWDWSERFSAQPEILEYANHVADRFDLRRGIEFSTTVTAAHFNEESQRWTVTTDKGESLSAQFCVMATGCISAAQTPEFEGLADYRGTTYHTGNWPHEEIDFTGKRIAVIGTGSSAIQAIPVLAEQAEHVTVFQRTPNYSLPSRNGPMTEDYANSWKDNYAALREEQRHTPKGALGEFRNISGIGAADDERATAYEERWDRGGSALLGSYRDMLVDESVNETAAEFVRDKIRTIVKDPQVAELLAAKGYPIGTKRICIDSGYFETFNRDNVALVDLNDTPIDRITPNGLATTGRSFDFDAIVFATGFDAMTGTLFKIDIQGLGGATLRDKWQAGPRTYLGLMTEAFPNLFMITGPGSPSVLTNMMVSIEQHVDWVTDCLEHMRADGLATIAPTLPAQDEWVEHVNVVAHRTLFPKAASWYMGANIPGKPRIFMPYVGGAGTYRKICDDVVADGYKGFDFLPGTDRVAAAE
ncbi:MAG: NAD(P)/FAD-dependent oxidoreductase [Rhodospirillaceae bacterium]|jgi:cyclohexanone monooxygenase|nr:NAD(P)/FAD-dependent oxidoreductase [Rhodospirillaceae bacterium]MBT5899062.1 NAD(P)/FAD-dependent oxidoreductase [Rhodospirillaceae bacterium]